MWDKVCFRIETGGLGVRDVGSFSMTLLAKWKWRIGVEVEGEWRDILDSRYRSWRDMRFIMVDWKSSTWWKDLCRVCDVGNDSNWFDNRIS